MSKKDSHGSLSGPAPTSATNRHPSPIPPHVRPSASRSVSSSSTACRSSRNQNQPYHQQREYIPSTIEAGFGAEPANSGLNQRWAYERAEDGEGGDRQSQIEEDEDEDDGHGDGDGDGDSQADWDAIRERDHASRPAWRRPSPRWLYPFVSGATLALGMGVAPRSELYINLACLAHPPQVPNSLQLHASALQVPAPLEGFMGSSVPVMPRGTGAETGSESYSPLPNEPSLLDVARSVVGLDRNVNASIPTTPSSGIDDEISPGDKWFYKLQHDIYEYKRSHHLSTHPSEPSASATSPGTAEPTAPIPHQPSSPGDNGDPHRRPGGSVPSDGPGEGSGKTENDPPYRQIDPKICKKDPKVQAAAAKLTMTMAITTGILSALTTGYWGQMSDRIGRRKMMALVESGLCINEICFILVAMYPYLAPGGYRSLLIGPTIEGFLGGISTLTATVNAYVSDTTPNGSRASVFARMGGIFMLGFAFGPMLGSFVIKATGNIMTPFYLNVCLHFFYVIMILLVLPESLSSEARQVLRKTANIAKDARKRRDILERQWENETPAATEIPDPFSSLPNPTPSTTPAAPASSKKSIPPSPWRRFSTSATPQTSKREKRFRGWVRRVFRKGTAFLQPLEVFMPVMREDGSRDWNMTATGAALFSMALLYGVYQVKSQYTLYSFGWTSAQLGPYLSFLGFSRGFVMLVLLPLAMKLAKPYFVPADPSPIGTEEPSPENRSHSSFSDSTIRPDGATSERNPLLSSSSPPARQKVRRPATLDLWTARLSLLIESSSYFILAFGLPEIPYVAMTGLTTLGSGSGPAVNSLALSFIPNSREAGKLFGGVAVLHALGSTLLGPLMFGTLFSNTVGSYAAAVWALAGVVQAGSLILMCCVRIPGQRAVWRGRMGK